MTAWCLLFSWGPRGGVPRDGVPGGAVPGGEVPGGGVLRGACLAAVLGLAANVWPVLLRGSSGAGLLWGSRLSWDHSCQQPACMANPKPQINERLGSSIWTYASCDQVYSKLVQML